MHVARWTVIIPVKRLAVGKSRLRDAPADDAFVLGIALDTITAARAAPGVERVLVVTADTTVAAAAATLGAEVAPDPGGGLNAAVGAGAARATSAVPRAALLADLPALRSDELADALVAMTGTPGRGYVADHAGTGTTLLGALPGRLLDPHFGPGSATAHAATGAVALDGDWPGLRLDVDTAADLAEARRLGLGAHTAAALNGSDGDVWPDNVIDAVC